MKRLVLLLSLLALPAQARDYQVALTTRNGDCVTFQPEIDGKWTVANGRLSHDTLSWPISSQGKTTFWWSAYSVKAKVTVTAGETLKLATDYGCIWEGK